MSGPHHGLVSLHADDDVLVGGGLFQPLRSLGDPVERRVWCEPS